MSGPAGATASILLQPIDEAGNWPMLLDVKGLPELPKGETYTLWLTRKGKLADPCGTFLTRRRVERDLAQRAVQAEAVRRLGRRAHRLDEAVPAPHRHRLTPPERIPGEALSSVRVTAIVRTQYEDFARHVMTHRGLDKRPHRHRHPQPVRPPVALRPGGDSRWSPPRRSPGVGRLRAAVVPPRRHQLAWLRRHGVTIWDEWAARTAISARSTASVAVLADARPAATSTRSAAVDCCAPIPTPAGSCQRLERRRLPPWRCRRATRSSSSTSPATAGSAASSTSAAPTCSSACRSTSPATRC